jgi:hypothetical protein
VTEPVAHRGYVAIANLAIVVAPPPALDDASDQRAGVITGGGDGVRGRVHVHRLDGNVTITGGGVAERAQALLPQHRTFPCRQQGKAVSGPGGDRLRGRIQANHLDGNLVFNDGAIAKLAVAVVSPALDATTHEQRAGVIPANGYRLNRRFEANHPYGSGASGGGAIAELSIEVVTPALEAAIAKQRTRVTIAGGDGLHLRVQSSLVTLTGLYRTVGEPSPS